MMTGLRFFISLVMLAGLGTYFYLNADKVGSLSFQVGELVNGESALDVELKSDSESIFHYRLRSSDIFDASGTKQVSFHRLDPDVYARMRDSSEELKLIVNGDDVPFRVVEKGKAVQLIWADRKVNIVQSGDMQVIAENIAYENNNQKGILDCYRVGRFCQSIRISSERIGSVEGPYLDSESGKTRRGLPKGSWAYGPSSKIRIESKISTEAYVGVYMLRISEDQEVNASGPILGQQPIPVEEYTAPYGGLQLYPEALMMKIRLRPGVNDIDLSYSMWMQSNIRDVPPRAVYITNIRIRENGRQPGT